VSRKLVRHSKSGEMNNAFEVMVLHLSLWVPVELFVIASKASVGPHKGCMAGNDIGK
jgi:hypothetical protein